MLKPTYYGYYLDSFVVELVEKDSIYFPAQGPSIENVRKLLCNHPECLHAIAEHYESISSSEAAALMNAYDKLSTFLDVNRVLMMEFTSDPNVTWAVFTDIISVDKSPGARYKHPAERMGKSHYK
ncbi:hypothetical protein P175DRAFT_0553905 [Aspergillus ochraceoroseus IBT 24754]|uniref:Uncharacterized protein n=1 Tax=Aspergillus ochraceoroseus IBT 24754 TaxID=1392256 RepID=A0A2T5M7V4_9EURO|nr:uncharacterized protein P175DRAFT_0553905 [Aspergillus ochraceoroseus IBT 24754]PTU24619.1 hypothetical protein P175DRAFT_0553905 [Aspergillus ochraceoroseus IBT 24754]